MGVPKLPTIDLSVEKLKTSYLGTCKEVREALEDYGCFVVNYEDVSHQLHESLLSESKKLFDLPTDVKMRNISDKPYFGYVGNHPSIPPNHESLGISNSTILEHVQTFTNLMWPSTGNENFCETMIDYAIRVSKLEKLVKRMVFESYGVGEKCYDSHVESSTFLLRLIKYKSPDELNKLEIGCHAHTDKSFLTILHQDEVNGLEIQTKDGQHWIGFQPSPSSFLVMAGDAFLAWSNGRIYAAPHRVVMSGRKARYSTGLFTYHEGVIHIPNELVDHQHPLQFKPFNHYGLLNYFSSSITAHSSSKAYCGL
ncbi:hypothetical protein CsatA_021795 [Cannabis sativa]